MTSPDDKHRGNPRERFRHILSAEKDDQGPPDIRKPPVVNLPRPGDTGQESAAQGAPSEAGRNLADGMRAARLLPTFWTAGGVLSIIANFVLFTMLISTWSGIGALNPMGSGGGALLGIYTSLDEMGKAHIRATIPVQTSIELDASVPVKTSTSITLARDVLIQGAQVTISTDLFNIDAPATVTLPAGTALDVDLEMNLPMQTSLPIAVDVPVDIAVDETDLHAAIRGLQDSMRPLLCSASPGATLPDGSAICR